MPSSEISRNGRMQLRHSPEMHDLTLSLYPKTQDILSAKALAIGSICSPGELHAAARYLAKSLAEYDLRRRKRIPDSLYTPLDEAYWREDLALKSDPANGLLLDKIALARDLRRQHFKEPEKGPGGARYALMNAIRHAWLICHDGSSVSYSRQTDQHGDHCGPLHDFIRSVTELLQSAPNTDGLHREIRSLDLQMHPSNKMP